MYEAFYNFQVKPFQLSPDPRFFYGSRGHKRAMSYLEYGLSLSEGFIVITGDVGAGKTTLVRSLFKKLETQNVVAAQLVSTQLEADDTLRMVAAAFGLPYENLNKAGVLRRIEDFLQSLHRQGKRALLVVDEAQNLAPRAVEELRMLSNFQVAERSLIQSFLLGQPEFRRILQSEGMQQLRQRVIASYHLGPMDAEETRAYIEHRLLTVGWKDDPALSTEAFARLHEFTGGIPRRINLLMDRLLLYGFLEEKHTLGEADVQSVIQDIETENPATTAGPAAALGGTEEASLTLNGSAAVLEEKMTQIEKDMGRLLPMVRKILVLLAQQRPQGRPQEQEET